MKTYLMSACMLLNDGFSVYLYSNMIYVHTTTLFLNLQVLGLLRLIPIRCSGDSVYSIIVQTLSNSKWLFLSSYTGQDSESLSQWAFLLLIPPALRIPNLYPFHPPYQTP